MVDPSKSPQRLDKWLWAARFYKTRSLAAQEIRRHHVQLNGELAKPAKEVRPGDRVRVTKQQTRWEVVVLGLSETRGPATVAQQLYSETPQSMALREQAAQARRLAPEPARSIAGGRPGKREHRALSQRKHDWGQRWSASLEDET